MLPDAYIAMGQTAENVASMRGISRAEQDEFAVRSQNLAEQAIKNGFYSRESPRPNCRTAPQRTATTAPARVSPSTLLARSSPCSAQTGR